jgi:hypothetical protein
MHADHLLLFYVIINLQFSYDGCEEILSIFFKYMKREIPRHLSGTLLKKKKNFFFLFIFLRSLYFFEYYKGLPQGPILF